MMRNLPVRDIVGAIDAAASRWSDAAFEPRALARDRASARSGYTLPVVDYAFDRLFQPLRREALEAVISREIGSLDALDRFVPRDGSPPARALGVGRVCVLSSRTTLGVAIVPAAFALCAKCAVLVKDRDDALVSAFFDTLAEAMPALAPYAQALAWEGAEGLARGGPLDAVVAFGTDETMAHIARALPYGTRFIGYPARASAGYVAREALASEATAREIAAGAARDLILYDGEGCLSLHALFVERGGGVTPARFAELLAEESIASARAFPAGRRDARDLARLASARDVGAFRGQGRVYADADASYVLLVDPPPEEPPLFLPRTLGVRSVAGPQEAVTYLQRHGIAIEALAVAGKRDDVRDAAITLGAARMTCFGKLQSPPLGGYHGGRPRIADFIRWIVDES